MFRLRGAHTGAALANALYECLQRYQIEDRLLTFCGDNASNNDTLADSLHVLMGSTGKFKGRTHRLRCFAHVLNLVMQASLLFHIIIAY
jgi:hypothetical protein